MMGDSLPRGSTGSDMQASAFSDSAEVINHPSRSLQSSRCTTDHREFYPTYTEVSRMQDAMRNKQIFSMVISSLLAPTTLLHTLSGVKMWLCFCSNYIKMPEAIIRFKAHVILNILRDLQGNHLALKGNFRCNVGLQNKQNG